MQRGFLGNIGEREYLVSNAGDHNSNSYPCMIPIWDLLKICPI